MDQKNKGFQIMSQWCRSAAGLAFLMGTDYVVMMIIYPASYPQTSPTGFRKSPFCREE